MFSMDEVIESLTKIVLIFFFFFFFFIAFENWVNKLGVAVLPPAPT